MVLPELFARIASGFSGSLKFWIVGDGKLRNQLEASCLSLPCEGAPSRHCEERSDVAIRFFGNQPSSSMPDIMNCVDVLVIPSLNEGLPLVCAEALRCGANVVGSDVGGVAEVIGTENVAPLGDDFVDALAGKALSYLAARSGQTPAALYSQSLSEDFSWSRTAARELELITSD
jgi:glycosyltransferase involved in cell wall biosynthesis